MKKLAFIMSLLLLISMLSFSSSALTVNGFIFKEMDDKNSLELSGLEYDIAKGDIVIPVVLTGGRVVAVGRNVFSYKQFITSVTLPESVKRISDGAFYMCVGLERVVIPQGTETVGDKCFALCEALEEVTIPHSVSSLGDEMFVDCKNLKTAYIYSTDGEIGENFFGGCENLESIYISKGTTTVSASAISDCTALKDIYCQGKEGDITFEGTVIADNDITVHYGYDYEGFNYTPPEVHKLEGNTPAEVTEAAPSDGGDYMKTVRNIFIIAFIVVIAGAAFVMIRKKKK